MQVTDSWTDTFPGLAALSDRDRRKLEDRAKRMHVPAGTVVFGPGRQPEALMLLVKGTVRVQQISETGREIVLYRVHAGESCVMTTACLLTFEDYSAEGIAETDIDAISVPRAVFDDLMANSPEFRTFVFTAYSRRMIDLFMVVEEIAFKRMDIRLAEKLLELRDAQDTLDATHQQLAVELGTAREVISRQLQEFQRRGWVELSRGKVKLTDLEAIGKLAEAT